MRVDLGQAMKERDAPRVKVLRTTLAAIENAEAVEGVATVDGVPGYADVARRVLGDEEIVGILRTEVDEWTEGVAEYRRIGQEARADGLQRELEILQGYLSES
jgi:uncharacterized protein YqeY